MRLQTQRQTIARMATAVEAHLVCVLRRRVDACVLHDAPEGWILSTACLEPARRLSTHRFNRLRHDDTHDRRMGSSVGFVVAQMGQSLGDGLC